MAFFWKRASAPPPIRAEGARSAQIDGYLASQIRSDGPGLALAVVDGGTLAHAAGRGLADVRKGVPISQDTIFHLASCGKQFTGLGILMLAEERKLQIDDPIGKHLGALARFGPRVTIRQLLHHTSGIRDFYDDAGIDEVLARCARPSNADIIRTYADLGCPMAERGLRPGDTFSYSNSGYDLLGAVIEQVSGATYRDFFQRRVFDPLGMKDTFSVPDRRSRDRRCAKGYALDERGELVENGGSEFDDLVGSGSFYTTVTDLCVYDRALRANSLVSEAGMREAFISGRTNDGALTDYGFGWYLGSYEGMRVAEHEGEWNGHYTYVCRFLDRPLGIFVLSNNPAIAPLEVATVATDAFAQPQS
jgi:CubicO group peptidase (beta-lactamase class C family)